jgi:uncharacterized damage-inducible protein DinB
MSEKSQLVLLSHYNRLMNERLYAAAAQLPAARQRENKGAFFESLIGTLNHILVGDILWLKRFARHPSGYKALAPLQATNDPTSLREILYLDWAELQQARDRLDRILIDWCADLKEEDLARPFSYQDLAGRPHNKHFGGLVLHLFLHQVHHRGQATTLLSQEGIDFGETDLPELLPDEG